MLEILLARVAGDVDEGHVLPQDLGAAAEQRVDHAADRALVAGDDARRRRSRGRPRPTCTYLCSPAAMSESAEFGSPWLPVERITCRCGGQLAELLERQDERPRARGGSRAPRRPRRWPSMLRPRSATWRPKRDGQVEDLLDAVDVRGEGRHDDAARAPRRTARRGPRPPRSPSRVCPAGRRWSSPSRGRARRARRARRSADSRRCWPSSGVRVELEIAGVDDGADRRLDRQADAVGDRVGHADGLDA